MSTDAEISQYEVFSEPIVPRSENGHNRWTQRAVQLALSQLTPHVSLSLSLAYQQTLFALYNTLSLDN